MPGIKELIIISLKGFLYGVWSDEVRVYSKLGRLHRFPLFPKHFAGVADVEGRMASLLDLAVTIGHSPISDKLSEQALIVGGTDAKDAKTEGFIFSGRSERVEVPPEEVFPMPEYLRVPEFSECVFNGGRLIPVINITTLHKRASRGDWVRPVLGATAGLAETSIAPSGSSEGPFRVFSVSGEDFAAPENLTGDTIIPDATTIRALPLTRPEIKGIVFHQGAVHAVVDVAECLGLKKPNLRGGIARGDTAKELDYGVIFITEGAGLGFLADVDKGTFRPGKDARKGKAGKKESDLRPLPEVARTELIGDCLTGKDEPLPVLRVYEALGPAKDHYDGAEGDDHDHEDGKASGFMAVFSTKEVEVVEFSIAGMWNALPYMETREIIGVKPWRELPGLPSIIRGVAELNGDPLPVVDLAACFGKRTRTSSGSRFILMESVENGESPKSGQNARKTKLGGFKALVLAPSPPKKRMVLLEDQRELPITQARDYVYGCYIEGKSARLILNVEALITDFDERALEDYFESLGGELGMGPLEQSPDLEGTGLEGMGEEIDVVDAEGDVNKDDETEECEEDVLGEDEAEVSGEPTGYGPSGDRSGGDKSGEATSDTAPPDAALQGAGALGETAPDAEDTGDTGDYHSEGTDLEDARAGKITEVPEESGEDDEPEESDEFEKTDELKKTAETPVEVEGVTPLTKPSTPATAPEVTPEQTPEPTQEPTEGTADDTPSETPPEIPDETPAETLPESRDDEAEADKQAPISAERDIDDRIESRTEASHPIENEVEDEVEDKVHAERESADVGKSAENDDDNDKETGEDAADAAEETVLRSVEPPGGIGAPKDDDPRPAEAAQAEAPVETMKFGSGETGVPGKTDEAAGETSADRHEGAQKTQPPMGNDKGPKNSAFNIGLVALFLFLIFGAYLLLRPSGERGDKEQALKSEAIEKETAAAHRPAPDKGPLLDVSTRPGEDDEVLSEIDTLPKKAAAPVTPPEPVKETVSIVPPEAPIEASEGEERATQVTPLKATGVETHVASAPIETPDTPDTKDTNDISGTKKTHILVEVEPERRKITVREVAEIPSDARVYKVKKGDTLWHIAGRFTGNPFNYPKIAEDSEIENADLIYPDQRIFIRLIEGDG